MPRKNVDCDQCGKEIRGEEIAYFSDAEKDLDFCSRKCYLEGKKKWIDIHKNFAKEWYNGKTYQQEWEEKGLTYQDAKEWIPAGFKPGDCREVKRWKNYNFTP